MRRILLAKARYGILDWQPPGPSFDPRSIAGAEAHREAARTVARDSVTLAQNRGALLPLAADSRPLLVAPSGVGDVAGPLRACLPKLRVLQVARNPSRRDVTRAVQASADASAIIVATTNARRYPGQVRLVESLEASRPGRVAVAALWSAYDLLAFPQVSAYLATYGDTPAALEMLAAVICGQEKARGRLPVELPGLFAVGHGL